MIFHIFMNGQQRIKKEPTNYLHKSIQAQSFEEPLFVSGANPLPGLSKLSRIVGPGLQPVKSYTITPLFISLYSKFLTILT